MASISQQDLKSMAQAALADTKSMLNGAVLSRINTPVVRDAGRVARIISEKFIKDVAKPAAGHIANAAKAGAALVTDPVRSTESLVEVKAVVPLAGGADLLQKTRDFINPITSRREMEETAQQTLRPEYVQEQQQKEGKRAGVLTFPGQEDLSFDPTGMIGLTKRVGATVTTKVLERLKGKLTTSKQEILDLSNMADLKQPERDLIRRIANEYEGAKISVPDFANKVKSELLPLKRESVGGEYESIVLPDELRGPVADYDSHVYRSPIKTSAGDVHFGNVRGEDDLPIQDYFAHTRIEDLPDNTTRRVIEAQSDLFQKGRLSAEMKMIAKKADEGRFDEGAEGMRKRLTEAGYDKSYIDRQVKENFDDYNRLEPYRNTWHERIIREEVKQAAVDGKTKLQFPTGETALRIEGLGVGDARWLIVGKENRVQGALTPGAERVGMTIDDGHGPQVIVEVLENGKFKAAQPVTKAFALNNPNMEFDMVGDKIYRKNTVETFDISGKVDTNNPIYKFYEKDVQKYLKNKYGGKVITDPQGVTWVEIDVPKGAGRAPVEAFGVVPAVDLFSREKTKGKNEEGEQEKGKRYLDMFSQW